VNCIAFMIIASLIAYSGYALWDSKQLHRSADKSNYAVYKPTAENQGKSFGELQALNAEVFAWLCVYGTNIDYPVAQGSTNMKYVNTNAEGRYSLSGSLFLDYHNSKDFSDFNSIIYGHHMAKKVMFGEIGDFFDRSMFDSHMYGSLYFDGKDHGIEFFAFIRTDAYDSVIFTPNVEEGQREKYLDGLLAKAVHVRETGVSRDDRLVLLSTCSSSSTNGRDILVGKVTDNVYDDSSLNTIINDEATLSGSDDLFRYAKEPYTIILIAVVILVALIIVYILVACHISKQHKQGNGGKD